MGEVRTYVAVRDSPESQVRDFLSHITYSDAVPGGL